MGIAWASGINLYAAIAMLGLLGASGNIDLPPDLLILQNPLVIAAAGFMYMVEFFADKAPGIDTGWDGIHTFIRIPAGAVLAAGAVGEVGAGAELAALIVGGTLAGATERRAVVVDARSGQIVRNLVMPNAELPNWDSVTAHVSDHDSVRVGGYRLQTGMAVESEGYGEALATSVDTVHRAATGPRPRYGRWH